MSINEQLSWVVPAQGQYWWSHYSMQDSPKSPVPPPPPPTPTTSTASASASASASAPHHSPLHLYPPAAAAAAASAGGFDLNNLDDQDQVMDQTPTPSCSSSSSSRDSEELIPLFDKPLTPSDVGKLNRLVIPKQHAEKHFPLNGNFPLNSNGLLLGFEDDLGKSWRFRYSYWNSSQSYVLTKGWSRFVKDKRLHAGDIVIFSRHRHYTGRLFIGWRRRNTQPPTIPNSNYQPHTNAPPPPGSGSSAAASHGNINNSKRQLLRLFGVNLECHTTDNIHSHPLASPHHQQYHHMDMSFSGAAADVYRQG